MFLQEKIKTELRSLDPGNKRFHPIRKVISELQYYQTKNVLSQISDQKVIEILKQLTEKFTNLAKLYSAAGRDDLAMLQTETAMIIMTLLPPEISESEIREMAEKIISESETGNTINRVMGRLMDIFKNRNINGSLASSIVQEMLAGN